MLRLFFAPFKISIVLDDTLHKKERQAQVYMIEMTEYTKQFSSLDRKTPCFTTFLKLSSTQTSQRTQNAIFEIYKKKHNKTDIFLSLITVGQSYSRRRNKTKQEKQSKTKQNKQTRTQKKIQKKMTCHYGRSQTSPITAEFAPFCSDRHSNSWHAAD